MRRDTKEFLLSLKRQFGVGVDITVSGSQGIIHELTRGGHIQSYREGTTSVFTDTGMVDVPLYRIVIL